jgi:hypothetical protein
MESFDNLRRDDTLVGKRPLFDPSNKIGDIESLQGVDLCVNYCRGHRPSRTQAGDKQIALDSGSDGGRLNRNARNCSVFFRRPINPTPFPGEDAPQSSNKRCMSIARTQDTMPRSAKSIDDLALVLRCTERPGTNSGNVLSSGRTAEHAAASL